RDVVKRPGGRVEAVFRRTPPTGAGDLPEGRRGRAIQQTGLHVLHAGLVAVAASGHPGRVKGVVAELADGGQVPVVVARFVRRVADAGRMELTVHPGVRLLHVVHDDAGVGAPIGGTCGALGADDRRV